VEPTHTSSLSLLDRDCGWLFVQTDTEALQLVHDDLQIIERFQDVQDDENEVTGSSDSDDLTTSTFAVLCTLNDTCS
jgi:hypothetical protein